ncbi:hypothetical protein AEA09_11505 [Lysinibacillus contaminans]|uniref:ROK family protein n=1 Tax=Lysinibacillus contaminans TaxID=1293441 RepID=A0ABR5K2L8_9BACI|nr:ROK family protein [Lysinibacillus contaminans]KOS69109.1 hypothetical protein AEA09_11505 [Lysinibacillus contaminans]
MTKVKILAAYIGGTPIKAGISDQAGKFDVFKEFDTESKKGGKYLVEKLIKIISEFQGFDMIGISIVGPVNSIRESIWGSCSVDKTIFYKCPNYRYHITQETVENSMKNLIHGHATSCT